MPHDQQLYDEGLYDGGRMVNLAGLTGGEGSMPAGLQLRLTLQGLTGGEAACAGVLSFLSLPAPAAVRVAPWLRPGG